LFIGQGQGHLKVKVRESYAPVKDLSEGTFCVNRNSIMQSVNNSYERLGVFLLNYEHKDDTYVAMTMSSFFI